MAYLKINGTDFSSLISGLKVGYETLVSDSGRNAAGDMYIDMNSKTRKIKLYCSLRHTTADEMRAFLKAIEPFVVDITFLNPETKALTTINAYTGTPEPEYYTIQPTMTIYKPMELNFIEL